MLAVRNLLPRAIKPCSARLLSNRAIPTPPSRLLNISEEVRYALETRLPVVALESTIITHGLPFPTNVEMAAEVESLIRGEGAVPATMAFLDGVAKVGLSSSELEQLAARESTVKISRRDIPYVLAQKLTGGTTISATMILAHMAGIDVFATGGLGGVHRGVAETWDVSADLEELGRTPVAVVCSGPKSILDIPKTIEYLETKGCHVSTYSPSDVPVNVPGFFTTDSGVPSPFQFPTAVDAARTVYEGTKFGLQSGYVFCIPADADKAMDSQVVNDAIHYALAEAESHGISGKATTPFLLKKVWEATGGDSVKTNVEFVKNNARFAARIARNITAMRNGGPTDAFPLQSMQQKTRNESVDMQDAAPSTGNHELGAFSSNSSVNSATESSTDPSIASTRSIHMPVQLKPKANGNRVLGPRLHSKASVVVAGALSQDITCTLDVVNISVSSYPGRVTTSLGGTAHNVALAAAYSGAPTKLISCIGDREESEIAKSVSPVIDVSGVRISSTERTPRYVCTNDSNGELIVACADMDAVYSLDSKFISDQIAASDPEICVFDGNIGPEQQAEILSSKQRKDSRLIVFEPTSVPKAARLAEQKNLRVFPNASLDIATPNHLELVSMFEEFSFRERFDIDNWFPIIDRLPLSDPFTRMKLDIFARSHPALEKVVVSGLVQASIQLLPFIPNIFVTNGPNGIVSFQLIENLRDRTGGVKDGPNSVYIISKDRSYGILIQHFPVMVEVADEDAKSVNGIGDTFCGALVAQLAKSRTWLRDDGPLKKEHVQKAMHAASLSLQTYQAVNSDISSLFE